MAILRAKNNACLEEILNGARMSGLSKYSTFILLCREQNVLQPSGLTSIVSALCI